MTNIKDNYQVTLTQDGWTGIESIAEKFNLSVSELLERVGSGELAIVEHLYLQDALAAEADPENQERISWEQVKQRLRLLPISNKSPRIPGEDKGKVIIAPDFNDPLPEDILNDFLNPANPQI